MEKSYRDNKTKPWTIDTLSKSSDLVDFPEFQREPTIWKLDRKQRLIDSIFRGFDISSIYLHKREDGKYDCIDGQQRINAIWSYLGINERDDDNGFHSKIENEIFDDKQVYNDVNEKRFGNLDKEWQQRFKEYELNIVFIDRVTHEDELNLQFIRLQLGAPLRAGEKLNAMKGDMRDLIFRRDDDAITSLDYFKRINIRKARYGIQEVAAQILLNAFSKKEYGEFHRSRYVDIQEFLKEKEKFCSEDKKYLEVIINTLNFISEQFNENLSLINSKALTVSVYLFVSELIELNRKDELNSFIRFFTLFIKTKEWQVSKGLDINLEYRGILNFQSSLTQAANEKAAIQQRHDFWRDYFSYFKETKLIRGDEDYKKNYNKNPDVERGTIK